MAEPKTPEPTAKFKYIYIKRTGESCPGCHHEKLWIVEVKPIKAPGYRQIQCKNCGYAGRMQPLPRMVRAAGA